MSTLLKRTTKQNIICAKKIIAPILKKTTNQNGCSPSERFVHKIIEGAVKTKHSKTRVKIDGVFLKGKQKMYLQRLCSLI